MTPLGGYAGVIRNNRARARLQHWRGLQRGGVWSKCDKAGKLVAQGAGVGAGSADVLVGSCLILSRRDVGAPKGHSTRCCGLIKVLQ